MSSTRRDLRTNLYTTVDTWRTEVWNPSQSDDKDRIHQGYRARPASLHPPAFYIGSISEILAHMGGRAGVRDRTFQAPVALVRGLYSNEEAMEWLDEATDSLLDYLSARPWCISSHANLTPTTTEDVELDLGGGTIYVATILNNQYGSFRDSRTIVNP